MGPDIVTFTPYLPGSPLDGHLLARVDALAEDHGAIGAGPQLVERDIAVHRGSHACSGHGLAPAEGSGRLRGEGGGGVGWVIGGWCRLGNRLNGDSYLFRLRNICFQFVLTPLGKIIIPLHPTLPAWPSSCQIANRLPSAGR